ncbi:MAG: hypothetical protein IJF92_01715 [Bacilli bacterium]|nr:hypothetical protein [Bacilli bacterium]
MSSLGLGFMIPYIIVMLAVLVLTIVAMWKIFVKAGKPGWASIIPFYNLYKEFEIAGMNGWMFLLLCIPIVNIIMTIVLYVKLAKVFGKGIGFAIGLIFLNFIFTLILAFGKAEYVGPQE